LRDHDSSTSDPEGYRAAVVLVSTSLLMLAIQVMQQILKDARMRDAPTRSAPRCLI